MLGTESSVHFRRVFFLVLISIIIAGADLAAQAEKDPHRPPCTDASCRKIKAFLRRHYCGASPGGNGPEDGCDLLEKVKPSPSVRVVADYNCEWNAKKDEADCQQHGQASEEIRRILMRELHELGLPAQAPGETYFTVWKSERADWSLAAADYSHRIGSDLELCVVIAVVAPNGRPTILRKLPLKKTDADVPDVTEWEPVDIADTTGSGEMDVILAGNEYENHWLEVVRVKAGSTETIFSGLGYYL